MPPVFDWWFLTMIEIYVFVIMLVSALLLLSSFFKGVSLFINLVLIALILILLSTDLKKKELHKYYLISLFATAIFFILSSTKPIKALLDLTTYTSLSLFTVAFILVYVLAHISGLVHMGIETLAEKYKK
ncbi:hypothetical protein J4458_00945 [Candidatus Woesearchaeota archaeon]|nr:hypothetical protein [Candidatus Woesearchaeota archaeon]